MTGKWQHTFKRVRVPLLNDIHYGGHVGSQNRKRGWVLHWHELIPDELGQGGWRDWLRSLCVPSSRETFINSSFSVWHNKGYVEGYIIIFFSLFLSHRLCRPQRHCSRAARPGIPHLRPHPRLISHRGPAHTGPQETSDRRWAAIRRGHCTAHSEYRFPAHSFKLCHI